MSTENRYFGVYWISISSPGTLYFPYLYCSAGTTDLRNTFINLAITIADLAIANADLAIECAD